MHFASPAQGPAQGPDPAGPAALEPAGPGSRVTEMIGEHKKCHPSLAAVYAGRGSDDRQTVLVYTWNTGSARGETGVEIVHVQGCPEPG